MRGQSREDYLNSALARISEFEGKLAELESHMESDDSNDIAEYRVQLKGVCCRPDLVRAKMTGLEASKDSARPFARKETGEILLRAAFLGIGWNQSV